MEVNTVQVQHAKCMSPDERETAHLDAFELLSSAIEAGEQYAVVVLHGDIKAMEGSTEIVGGMSPTGLALAANAFSTQAFLSQAPDAQAALNAIVNSNRGEAA